MGFSALRKRIRGIVFIFNEALIFERIFLMDFLRKIKFFKSETKNKPPQNEAVESG